MASPYQRANSVRVSRNRGCNESFRAAVDRSYEKDFPEAAAASDYVIQDLSNDSSDHNVNKVVMRRKDAKSTDGLEARKKNRNSKLLRGLGTMFKIGNNNTVGDKTTKDTKHMRKSNPEALTSASSLASSTASTASRGPIKSANDLEQQPQYYQQNQMRLFPQQYIQQPQPRSHSQPRYRPHPPDAMYEYMPSAMMRPGSRVGIADPTSTEIADYDVITRLQNTHVAPQPPPASRQPTYGGYVYPQPYMYNQYG